MARIKYDPAATPLTKKHFGFTFLSSSIGKSMAPGQRNARTRYPNQSLRQQNLQKCIRQWRNMDPATVANWNAFAAAYQQPTKRNPTIYLSGYQLFLKRNSYCFLNHGIDSDFMETPAMEELAAPVPTFELKAGSNVVDVTELYIHNFGILPEAGQWLLFWAVPYSDTSGQFFAPIHSVLECEEVFIDGLFLNLVIPDGNQNITYSVYLSKPVHAGSSYGGTKIRYMGCFTTKSFLGLSDTPGSYAGQAGKVPTVNLAENALEFAAGGGGGLTCEDLPACPSIININSSLQLINSFLATEYFISLPAVKYGLLYNFFAVAGAGAASIANTGFHSMTDADYVSITTFLGGSTVCGVIMKEIGLVYWRSPNTDATNASRFNGRGSGQRTTAGLFTLILNYFYCHLDSADAVNSYSLRLRYDAITASKTIGSKKAGAACRIVKDVTTLTDGQTGSYIGNNGRTYRTICIGTVEITADNVAETLLRDLTAIPEITSAAIWGAASTGAFCAYNNDWANV